MVGWQEGCVRVCSYNNLVEFLMVVIRKGALVGSLGQQS
jgi:hypothetical protein